MVEFWGNWIGRDDLAGRAWRSSLDEVHRSKSTQFGDGLIEISRPREVAAGGPSDS
jgi:hypothetical protein